MKRAFTDLRIGDKLYVFNGMSFTCAKITDIHFENGFFSVIVNNSDRDIVHIPLNHMSASKVKFIDSMIYTNYKTFRKDVIKKLDSIRPDRKRKIV